MTQLAQGEEGQRGVPGLSIRLINSDRPLGLSEPSDLCHRGASEQKHQTR